MSSVVRTELESRETDAASAQGSDEAVLPETKRSGAAWQGGTPGQQIGNYRLVAQIGEGGFGIVWQASQERPLRRMVALKILKPGMDSREVVARFAMERQALAMMEHPGIATVLDAGTTVAGRPFFVMEMVDGLPVTRFCDHHRLDARARLRVMLEVCAAVQHAHQKGIIHRDLKPSNILVAGSPDDPQPKVIDFGVARAISPPSAEFTIHTSDQQLIGTPAYMSPEQAGTGGMDIDTRSDVYSLGVLLYQMLTGTTPFAAKTAGATPEEVRRIIRDEPVPAPSTALGRLQGDALNTVMSAQNTVLKDLNLLLRRDLDWIVIRALEKDRNRRYQTVTALAADIRRYLDGEPVLARPPGFGYRAGKFLRRHRRQTAAAIAILLSLAGGLAASTTMMVRERDAVRREAAERDHLHRETRRLQSESSLNEQTASFLSDLLASLNPDVARGADPKLMLKILDRAVARIGSELKDQPQVEAFLRNTIGTTYFTMGRFPEAGTQLKAALRLASNTPGPHDRLTLRIRSNLANVLESEKKYAEAEKENREILAARRQQFPPTDRETMITMANLANDIAKQGRMEVAEKLWSEVVDLQRQALDEDDPDTLYSRVSLANVRRELGRNLEEVLEEYRAIIRVLESKLTGNHPDTLAARFGYANALMDNKNFEAACGEHTVVWEIRKIVLGEPHRKTLQSGYAVGRALLKLGQFPEAADAFCEVLGRQAAAVAEGRLLPGDPDLANSRAAVSTVARFLAENQHFPEAAAAQRQLLESLPDGHPQKSKTMATLAEYLREQAKAPEAGAPEDDAGKQNRPPK